MGMRGRRGGEGDFGGDLMGGRGAAFLVAEHMHGWRGRGRRGERDVRDECVNGSGAPEKAAGQKWAMAPEN